MQIDINRTKSFNISLITEGMDISEMKFKFSLVINEITYSFPAILNGDSLKVVIPPLSEKIKNLEIGECEAFLETYTLNEDGKGYYLRPWKDTIELKKEPKISVNVQEEKEKTGLKAEIKEDDKPEPPPSYTIKETSDKKERKHTKFGKNLIGE